MRAYSNFTKIAIFATFLAATVVMLGAYTRLKDAGLGCPDWPGCYGQLSVPESSKALAKAQAAFPTANIIPKKAWPEMIHRYFAGTLGLLIFGLAGWAASRKRNISNQPLLMPILLVGLVIFQAVLGMWTVTWKLLPLVVMGHLLGGMTIATMLWWLSLGTMTHALKRPKASVFLKTLALLGIVIVGLQIFLGGWTSANYASIICPNFPGCNGKLFPTLHLAQAFNFTSPIGANYEGGLLDASTRITIQMIHRYGAIITAGFLCGFSLLLINTQQALWRAAGWSLLSVIGLQFILGVANIDTMLALPIAVAHNGVGLLLLLTIVTITHLLWRETE